MDLQTMCDIQKTGLINLVKLAELSGIPYSTLYGKIYRRLGAPKDEKIKDFRLDESKALDEGLRQLKNLLNRTEA